MNLLDLFVKIAVDDQASGEIATLSEKLGTGLQTAANLAVTAIAAVGTAVVGLAGTATASFAEYEQLSGGIETLFGKDSKLIQKNAEKAYKTAAVSVNKYMDTVTGFSATLLQELGGNTAEAAEMADLAITDMSDNVNKMGTDAEAVRLAYQGFARGQYLLLDNLRIGYSGTQTEMQRLVRDAAAVSDSVDANSLSFANVVQAIHVVQTEMGITGTTATEAATTISGSTTTMKAAWENLVLAMGKGTGDIDTEINAFVQSMETAANNALPQFELALDGVLLGVEKLAPNIAEKLPGIVTELVPKIIETASSVLKNFINFFTDTDNAAEYTRAALDIMADLGAAIVENVGTLVTNLPSLLDGVLLGVSSFIVDTFGIDEGTIKTWTDLNLAISDNKSDIEDYGKKFSDVLTSQTDIASKAEAAVTNTENLWKELQTLADENGNVQEANESRAKYILEELDKAYEHESELVNGQITNYQNLKKSIDDAIAATRWEIVSAASSNVYATAIQDEVGLHMELAEAVQNQQEAEKFLNEAKEAYAKKEQELANMSGSARDEAMVSDMARLHSAQQTYDAATKAVDEATLYVKQNVDAQIAYQQAQTLAQEGNFEEATRVLQTYTKNANLELQSLNQSYEEQRTATQTQFDLALTAISTYLDNVDKEIVDFNSSTLATLEQNANDIYSAGEQAGFNLSVGVATGIMAKYSEVDGAISGLSTKITDSLNAIDLTLTNQIQSFKEQLDSVISESQGIGSILEVPQETASEATGMLDRFGKNNPVTVINQNIYSNAQTAADLMEEAVYQQRRAREVAIN